MISDLAYISKNFYISNQVKSRLMYSSSGLNATDLHLHTRNFCYLVNVWTFIESIIRLVALTKLISIQERSFSYIKLVFYLYYYQKCLKVI